MLLLLPLLAAAGLAGFARAAEKPRAAATDEVTSWFRAADSNLVRLRIDIAPTHVQALRENPRGYVRAAVSDGSQTWTDVGVRVKGRVGSFRAIDDKPSLTLNFDKFVPEQHLAGLTKLHLNNSVEDPGYLHEKLGAEVFRAAGVPAPLVTHALVTLNGRKLGLYVVKEGFTPEFLARHFADATGNLYEPGSEQGQDVTQPMALNFGSGPTNRADLRALAEAAAETDPDRRRTGLERVLDRDRFLSFLALEIALGHRDGYAIARNNYRLYANPADHRFVFLPSGMDRLLPRAEATLFPNFSGTIARAIVDSPAGRAAYWERLGLLFTNVLRDPAWPHRIQAWAESISRSADSSQRETGRDLVTRWVERMAFIGTQLASPAPRPMRFEGEPAQARLGGWKPLDIPEGGRLDQVQIDGQTALRIEAGRRTSASWQTTVWLDPGRYHFQARVRGQGITPLPFGRNHGATLVVDGRTPSPVNPILGNADWTVLTVEFDVSEPMKAVELSCVLRASGGRAWFQADSLRLIRMAGARRERNGRRRRRGSGGGASGRGGLSDA